MTMLISDRINRFTKSYRRRPAESAIFAECPMPLSICIQEIVIEILACPDCDDMLIDGCIFENAPEAISIQKSNQEINWAELMNTLSEDTSKDPDEDPLQWAAESTLATKCKTAKLPNLLALEHEDSVDVETSYRKVLSL